MWELKRSFWHVRSVVSHSSHVPRVILTHPSNAIRINFINFYRPLFSYRDKKEIAIQMWELKRSLWRVGSVVSHSNKPRVILTHPSNTMGINFWVSRKKAWSGRVTCQQKKQRRVKLQKAILKQSLKRREPILFSLIWREHFKQDMGQWIRFLM